MANSLTDQPKEQSDDEQRAIERLRKERDEEEALLCAAAFDRGKKWALQARYIDLERFARRTEGYLDYPELTLAEVVDKIASESDFDGHDDHWAFYEAWFDGREPSGDEASLFIQGAAHVFKYV